MDAINQIVATNLKRVRDEQKLSLDKAAELTGVSKSMLGQIERGESNPTIQTIWKIANGLKVSLTSLIDLEKKETQVVKRSAVKPIPGDEGRIRIYPVFPFDEEKKFEIITLELTPGTHSPSEPHAPGCQEYIMVLEGAMTVKLGDETYRLDEGDAMRYKADQPHAYTMSATSEKMAKACMVITY